MAQRNRLRHFAPVLCAASALCFLGAGAAWAAVDIRIDLSTQTMRVTSSRGAEVWPVSTARTGYVTPRGSYRPIRLERMHYSRKYDNSPMPHSIFFKGGYAIHGTGSVRQLGRPASHGCVRLAPGNAARLFNMVQKEGARITLTGSPPAAGRRTKPASRRPSTSPLTFGEASPPSGFSLR